MQATATEFDFIEEIRLRTWARENYVSEDERDETWHPVVLDEMRIKDGETGLVVGEEAVLA
jgi:hypothetical protein